MSDPYPAFFDELSIIFSQERLDGYLNHATCNQSKTEALTAYFRNIQLSQSLYPALQIMEISLRNSLHQAISTHFIRNIGLNCHFYTPVKKSKLLKL